jgi:hypothetical protein
VPRDPTLGASITTNTRGIWPYHAPAVSNSSPDLVAFTLSARRIPKRSTAAIGNAAQVMRRGSAAIERSAKVKASKSIHNCRRYARGLPEVLGTPVRRHVCGGTTNPIGAPLTVTYHRVVYSTPQLYVCSGSSRLMSAHLKRRVPRGTSAHN